MSTRRLPATIALVAWTLLVWTTRIGNIWGDDGLTSGEKWGRTGLALSFTVLALTVAHAVWHRSAWRSIAVKALAGWTIGVWAVRSVGIATGDHSGAFVAVHLVLAVVSIALSLLATRESGRVAVRQPTASTPA
jgi:cobalamin synthase